MSNSNSKKIVLIAASIILLLVITLIIYLNKSVEDNFKYYNSHDITNNLKNFSPEDYINDKYLISLMMLDNYNGEINSNNIDDILYYYMTSITTSEKYKNNDSDVGFCLSKESFDDSILELFGKDSSIIYQLYYLSDYIEIKEENVCFKYSYFDLTDLDYFIAIDNINVNNDVIKAKVYLYGLDSDSSEESRIFKEDLLSAIKEKSLNTFNYLYSDNDLVEIKEKEITFKEIPNGDYFKYQLISINTK